MIEPWVSYLPTALYGAAAALAAFDLWQGLRPLRGAIIALVSLGLAARVGVLLEPGLCPLSTAGSGMGIVALFLALHLICAVRLDGSARVRTVALLGLILAFDAAGLLVSPAGRSIELPEREQALAEIHGGLILLACAAFAAGAVYSLLYVFLYRIIRRRRLGFWFTRLPSLWRLEAGSRTANSLGLIALTLGLCVGVYLLAATEGGLPLGDAVVQRTFLLWLLFAAEKACRWFLRWTGIRVMWVPLAGMVVILALMLAGETGHPFWSGS
ncbi:MAG: cytochrome c biogenesis protein CcsA [Planctomycetes bacterium]|nr:cytochrome c biogenesis protein CcsA [Planctomycetota bacterium]